MDKYADMDRGRERHRGRYVEKSRKISLFTYEQLNTRLIVSLSLSVYTRARVYISPYISLFLPISLYICPFLSVSVYIHIYLSISSYFRIYPHICLSFCIYPYLYPYFPIYPYLSVFNYQCPYELPHSKSDCRQATDDAGERGTSEPGRSPT